MTVASSDKVVAGRSFDFRRTVIALAVGIAAVGAPQFIYPIFLMNVLCFALFACAFNLLMGFTGVLSFGHAAFFGGAAYVSAYCAKALGFPAEVAILAGTASSALLGIAFGWIAIRKQGIYFGMITMALAQLVFFAAVQSPFTGGEDGIQGVPRNSIIPGFDLTSNNAMYYFVLAVFMIGFAIIYRTVHSPFGHILRAIKENESRAMSLGYDVERFKLIAFTLSATLSGLAGATKAIAFQLATLTDVEFLMSGEVVLMTLVGGVGTLFGPVVGAAAVVAMQHYLSEFGIWVKAIQGVIFIVCVLAFRKGIVGECRAFVERRRHHVRGG